MAWILRTVVPGMIALSIAGAAWAGGSSFVGGGDADDPRTTVFGFVKDRDGDPVDQATVTITMKMLQTDVVVQSDDQGHFSAKMFYNPVDPKDVALACGKDGYRQMAVVQRPPLGAGAPIEFDCVLEKK
jgi:hypothetical protein